jgi:hypothetical protein
MGKSKISQIDKKWSAKAIRIRKTVSFGTHIFVVLFSLSMGVIVFIFLNLFVLPASLPLPKTTAINWLVLNNHSMTLDYIRFVLFVLILQASTVIGWIIFIWKRKN